MKKVFLEISQNSQKNTCARNSFLIKLQARPAILLKKSPWHRGFPVNFAKFNYSTLFCKTPPDDCFCEEIPHISSHPNKHVSYPQKHY